MATGILDQLFQLDRDANQLQGLKPVSYADLGILETSNLHEWLADNIKMLGGDLLVIQREHVAINETQRRPDIVALDGSGRIVVVEVKRDPASGGAVWQSILYASYYQSYSLSDVVDMYREYADLAQEEAEQTLLQHLDAEDLADLNSGQRIIMVAPRFEPEVTNAALWLSDSAIDVACVELRPYHDEMNDRVFIQLNAVIPLPTRADVGVTVRGRRAAERQAIVGERTSRKGDAVSVFMNKVREAASDQLEVAIPPDRWSRWAGLSNNWRWFILWYDEPPWVNHHFCFKIWKSEHKDAEFPVEIEFHVWKKGAKDAGASDDEISAAHKAASTFGKRQDWKFDEPSQKKSFTVKRYFTPEESADEEFVGKALADLIESVAPKFWDNGVVGDGNDE